MRSTRRGFLLGLGALIAAPAVVKVSSIMPVRVPFDQRMVWSVYAPGAGASGHVLFMPYEDYAAKAVAPFGDFVFARENPTIGAVVTGEGEFNLYDPRAVSSWPERIGVERVERVPLSGVELQRYEALNLPRLELLRIGDRVVDKRHLGPGWAQPIQRTREERERLRNGWLPEKSERGLRTSCVYYGDRIGENVDGGPVLGMDAPSRAEVEARHQRSTRARRQAADVLERAKLATEQRRQALDVAAEAARESA